MNKQALYERIRTMLLHIESKIVVNGSVVTDLLYQEAEYKVGSQCPRMDESNSAVFRENDVWGGALDRHDMHQSRRHPPDDINITPIISNSTLHINQLQKITLPEVTPTACPTGGAFCEAYRISEKQLKGVLKTQMSFQHPFLCMSNFIYLQSPSEIS